MTYTYLQSHQNEAFLIWERLHLMARLSLRKKADKKLKKNRQVPKWLKTVGKVFAPILWLLRPLRPLGRYFKGAWYELRQVKWPSNKTSVKLTIAVIVFTLVMTGFIVILDMGFEQIVKRILL